MRSTAVKSFVGVLIVFVLIAIAGSAVARSAAASVEVVPLLPRYAPLQRLDLELPYYRSAVTDWGRNKLYLLEVNRLVSLNTRPLSIAAELPLMFMADQIALSQDGRRLYLAMGLDGAPSPTPIMVVDTETLTLETTLNVPCVPGTVYCTVAAIATGPGDRLYVLPNNHDAFSVLDGLSGAVLDTVRLDDEVTTNTLTTHGNSLYTSEFRPASGYSLTRWDISQPTPVPAKTVSTGNDYRPDRRLAVAPDGSFVMAHQLGSLAVYDAATLALRGTAGDVNGLAGIVGATLQDATISSDSAGILARVHSYSLLSMVELDAGTLSAVRVAGLELAGNTRLQGIVALADRRVAHVYSDHVSLLAPLDYSAALPLTFSAHCGTGPIIDDFSDSDSGWPVADNGVTMLRYSGETYQIRHREPNRIVLVTRGDVWNNSEQYEATGWLKAGDQGDYGIVFGLNDDWTEFYTLEVRPDNDNDWRVAFVLHYTAEAGWELMHSERGLFVVYPGTSLNRLGIELRPDDQNRWRPTAMVNGQPIKFLPDVTGRVGLLGVSLPWADADIRFDDYYLRNQNCPYSPPGPPTLAVHIMERPPLAELLRMAEMDPVRGR